MLDLLIVDVLSKKSPKKNLNNTKVSFEDKIGRISLPETSGPHPESMESEVVVSAEIARFENSYDSDSSEEEIPTHEENDDGMNSQIDATSEKPTEPGEKAPSGLPVGLVGLAYSAYQIMIQRQPPDEERGNGMITGYMVRYRLHGYGENTPWSNRNMTKENQRNYLIEIHV
ncbi:hypothetical protein DAPPUDRAFT_247975 [Daphnia pulex]|uniref:Fibronectin type-III domain-containing protein n=1 Tax=Daphnia pulex TaxID=6669 RepID=E9GTG3_DAPPU|nr:hypothetical protein DAPPUDRAFT_247975 [Daphnia pulex]|eukprot:EFX77079.1 hypothetical protein DAPPUDRAFT_247975 [Daphnia pulex]